MSDSSGQTMKATVDELCDSALEHYLKLSDDACHYNSLVPNAIETYRRVRKHYEKLQEYWNSPPKWKRGFDPHTPSEMYQLEEFLGYNSSSTKVKGEETE